MVRFRKPRPGQRHQGEREQGQHQEVRLPAKPDLNHAAGYRANGRGQRDCRTDEGERPGDVGPLEQVAHDRPAKDGSGAGRRTLGKTGNPQHLDAGCHRAGQAGQHIGGQTAEQHGHASDHVRQRAQEQLRRRKADQIPGDRRLHRRGRCLQRDPDCRQRGDIERDRQRSHPDQRRQQRDQCEMGTTRCRRGPRFSHTGGAYCRVSSARPARPGGARSDVPQATRRPSSGSFPPDGPLRVQPHSPAPVPAP